MSNKLPWQGTWNSTYGPLRLCQSGTRVYGDYGDRGPIEGTLVNGTLNGTFKNGDRSGRFTFTLNREAFDGLWAWDSNEPNQNWDGTRNSESAPALKFFPGEMLDPASWEGTWASTFGTLKLLQTGNRVIGDYRDLGPIEATYNPTTRRLQGSFHNTGKPGNFYWDLAADGQSFTGKWAWGSAAPNGEWSAKKNDSATPTGLHFVKNGQPVVDKPTKPAPTPDTGKVGEINGRQVAIVPAGSRRGSEQQKGAPTTQPPTAEGYVCTTTKYKVDATFNENYILAATQSNLYPGSIIDGRAYGDGQINPVNGARKPYTISPSYGGRSAQVSNATISTVRDALGASLPSGTTPAAVNFNTTTIKSVEDLRVHLRAGYDDGINKIKATGGYASKDKSNVIAVQFTQLYYTVDVDRPSVISSEAIFSDGTAISPDHMIVDQVGYGRMVNFLVETNYSEQEIEATLDYYGKYGVKKVDVGLELKHKTVFERSRFTAFVLGGGATQATELVISRGESLGDFLRQGANFSKQSPGLPIFYKLRFLKDWSQANVLFSTEITKTHCVHTTGSFDTGFDWLKVKEVSDPGDNEEIYGIGWIRCVVTPKRGGEPIRVNPTNFSYLDRHGRVFEIKPGNHRSISKGDAMQLMSNRIRFHVNAPDYGYASFDELKSMAYFEFIFEVKEKDDWGGDDNLGTRTAKVYLNEANIPPVPGKSAISNVTDYPRGVMDDFMDGGSRAMVRFSVEPKSLDA